jgi:cytoskeletal protein CcmA (bactofilin family)
VLHGSAVLVGSLHSKALVIEEGARVEGQVSMQGEAAVLSARTAAALDHSAVLPAGALPVEDEDAHLIEPLPAGEKTM